MRVPRINKSSYAEKYLRSALKNIGVKRAKSRGDRGTKKSVAGFSGRFRVDLPSIRPKKYQ